jgi:HD-GYP domain-containing protein (c-di-GMP phosphodiesterase class II)
VVEAISAHRPYRPGLGIDVALEEIAKNRDKFYDPQAVDACVYLFREQHYKFQSAS